MSDTLEPKAPSSGAAEDLGFDRDALKARYRAERDKRLRQDGNEQYQEIAGSFAHYLEDRTLILLSNREPYEHRHGDMGIEVRQPPGGLVSALDPTMQTTHGVWVAWGSGTADAETAAVGPQADRGDGEIADKLVAAFNEARDRSVDPAVVEPLLGGLRAHYHRLIDG